MKPDNAKRECWKCHAAVESEWSFCPFCGTRFSETRDSRPPKPELDMKFLKDIYSFSWYNHHVAMVAYYDAVGK
jgi:hypothetical protein